jgi:hypothetical protein
MIKINVFLIVICNILILLSCSEHSPEEKWVNPFDEDGQNWFPPTVIAMDDTTVFINDTVTLHVSYKDENGYVDTYFWAVDGNNFADTSDSLFETVFTSSG